MILIYLITILAIILGAYYFFKFINYRAKTESIKEYFSSHLLDKNLQISKLDNNTLIFKSNNTTNKNSALIFYPGGFVESTAYEPLMAAIAAKGIMCFLCKMPLNLAWFNINAANRIKKNYSEIKNWYIGGHSLGGLCSSFHLVSNINDFKGIIYLASYSIKDFSKSNIKVLSILGNEDKIINLKLYEKCKKNYPKYFKEIIIKGGNHSYFGMYGIMRRDGIPKITNIEQIEFSANQIINFIHENAI